MRLILCSLCKEPYALYSRHEKNGMDYLHWNQRLGEYIHPVCAEVYLNDAGKLNRVDMSPMKRLLGFDTIEREYNERFKNC